MDAMLEYCRITLLNHKLTLNPILQWWIKSRIRSLHLSIASVF